MMEEREGSAKMMDDDMLKPWAVEDGRLDHFKLGMGNPSIQAGRIAGLKEAMEIAKDYGGRHDPVYGRYVLEIAEVIAAHISHIEGK